MVSRSHFLRTAGVFALVCSAASVEAQSAAQSEGPPDAQPRADAEPLATEDPVAEQAIVITGSRVSRDGFDAPTPTTVLSSEELAVRGTPQVGEFLNEVPAFRASQTPQTNPQSARGAGQYFPDLRGLGGIRTLTLVNGRRHVPSSPEGQVDLNLIPTILIDRLEVVTGGASAQWGSDAVAGVVNVILNTRLEGLRGDLSYGITHYGDNAELRASLAYGAAFDGGRGHIVLGGEYVNSEGVASHWDRPFGRNQEELVSYTGTRPAGAPSRFYAAGVTPINMTRGGVIIGANTAPGQALRGIQFGPGGTLLPFEYGNAIGTAAIDFTGGEPQFSIRSGHTLVLPVERKVAMGYAEYEVARPFTVFAEGTWARAGSDFTTAFVRDAAPTGIVIRRENPFVPAPLLQILTSRNIAQFSVGREHMDFGRVEASNFNTTVRAAIGAFGDLGGGWGWDGYYQYGRNEFDSVIENLRVNSRFQLAVDAVRDPASGQAVCRDVTARAAGCVPINLLGFGSPSAQAIDYVTDTALFNVESRQDVMALNLRGEPMQTWAGPISIATGVERRVEESISVVDPISEARNFAYGNPQPFRGRYSVSEAYFEVVVPLARALPFAHSLDLNGAIRYADYSTSGGVWTWKAGITYEPTDWLRLRATRSRDIRAPNNSELFASTTSQFTLRNPFSGATGQFTVISGSSPTLQPETADTFTAGIVVSPTFLPGLRLSADFFDIDIQGAISGYSAQVILDNCFSEVGAGTPGFFCGFVSRTGTGAATVIQSVETQLLNIGGFRSRGIDFEAAYRFDLGQGAVNVRLFGTYTIDLISDDGLGVARTYNSAGIIQNVGSVIDRAGQVGGFTSSSNSGATNAPTWVLSGSLTYTEDRLTAFLQGRYVGGGIIDKTLVGPDDPDYNPASPISIAENTVDGRFYLNSAISYDIYNAGDRRVQLYGSISNITNVRPPFPYTAFAGLYDRVGRTYRVGVRFAY